MNDKLEAFLRYEQSRNTGSQHTQDAYRRDITTFIHSLLDGYLDCSLGLS